PTPKGTPSYNALSPLTECRVGTAAILVVVVIRLLAGFSPAQGIDEKLLSDAENAYNPISSPDGILIAYVRTGWARPGGSGGFGRSNLRSEIAVMTTSGTMLSRTPLADAFLFGWT